MNPINENIAEMLEDRFLRYVKIWTTSEPELVGKKTPSTDGQWELLRLLEEELSALGVPEVKLNEQGYLIATIPSNMDRELAPIGFMAHVDTSSDAPGKDVKPRIHRNWDGSRIELEKGVTLDPEDIPELNDFIGNTIISSDGTTLLGADDKAGIAEIMCAVEILMKNPGIKHGPLEIAFTPDEETGAGMDNFPLEDLKSRFCFTLDGGHEGELEMECYNAWRMDLEFQGNVIHPGAARGKLVNALSMAAQFVTLLPRSESPEATDGRYGNYWANSMSGDLDRAKVSVMIRDFDEQGAERRRAAVRSFAAAVEAAFPGGKILIEEKEQYRNMKKELDRYPELEPLMLKAYAEADVEPRMIPIRGGTDGSRLTAMGIPTPNIFAGGLNFHSVREWVPLESMEKAVRVILGLCEIWAES